MWIFTNRRMQPAGDASAFTNVFDPLADRLGVAQVTRVGDGFRLDSAQPTAGDDDIMQLLVPQFRGAQPVLFYLHGNNNSPAACFERCARLQEIYGLQVIGFSWPSEGFLPTGAHRSGQPAAAAPAEIEQGALAGITLANRAQPAELRIIERYRQAKLNAQDSGNAVTRLLRLLAAARLYANAQRFSIGAHSLGSHLLQYTIEGDGASEALGAAHNIVLLAACCRAEGHAAWVGKLGPKGRVYITYNLGDNVLFGAFVADGQQVKLGTEPGLRMRSDKVRYISFTNAQVGLFGHAYFVRETGGSVPKAAKKLFTRLFGSQRDFDELQGEYARQIYPVGCDADGDTCWMARPPVEPSGP